jgi:hypothetical protein
MHDAGTNHLKLQILFLGRGFPPTFRSSLCSAGPMMLLMEPYVPKSLHNLKVYDPSHYEVYNQSEFYFWSWSSPLGRGTSLDCKFPILGIPASCMPDKATKAKVMEEVARFLIWSMQCLMSGICPAADYYGVPYTDYRKHIDGLSSLCAELYAKAGVAAWRAVTLACSCLVCLCACLLASLQNMHLHASLTDSSKLPHPRIPNRKNSVQQGGHLRKSLAGCKLADGFRGCFAGFKADQKARRESTSA